MVGQLMKILKLQILVNQNKNAMNCLVMMHGVLPRFRFSSTDMLWSITYGGLGQITDQSLQPVLRIWLILQIINTKKEIYARELKLLQTKAV